MQMINVWAGQSQVSTTACESKNFKAPLATPHHNAYWHVTLKVSHIWFSMIISL
jgi:hypothetical protein